MAALICKRVLSGHVFEEDSDLRRITIRLAMDCGFPHTSAIEQGRKGSSWY